MTHSNEILLREAYEAQSRGDIDGYIDRLSDDFVLHIPGRSRIAGDYVGEEDVRRHFREIGELSEGTFRTDVRDGKLAEMWLYPADQYTFDDYWGTA